MIQDARLGTLFVGGALAGEIPPSGDPQTIDLDTEGIASEASITADLTVSASVSIDLSTEGIESLESVNAPSVTPDEISIDLDTEGIDDQSTMGVAPTIEAVGYITAAGGIGSEESVERPRYVDNETIYYDSRSDGWTTAGSTGPFNQLEPGNNETYEWSNDGSSHHYVAALATETNSSINPGHYNALSIRSRRVQVGTGTYSQVSSQTVTVTSTGHGLSTGDRVSVVVTSGLLESRTVAGDVDSLGAITVIDANQFYFTHPDSGTTSGNCTIYRNESGALSSRVTDGADGTAIFPATNIEVEAKVRFDPRHGLLPALWMRSSPGGSTSGEINLFEGFSAEEGDDAWRSSTHYLPGTTGTGLSNTTSRTHHVTAGTEDDWHIISARIEQHSSNEAFITYFFDGVQQGPNSPTGYNWRLADNSTGWFSDQWDFIINVAVGGEYVGDPAILPYNDELWGSAGGGIPGAGATDVTTWTLGEEPQLEVDYLLVKSITIGEPVAPEIRWESECSGTDGTSVAADDFNFTSGSLTNGSTTEIETSVSAPDSVWLKHTLVSVSDAVHSFDFPDVHERTYGRTYFRMPTTNRVQNDFAVLVLRDEANAIIGTIRQYVNIGGQSSLFVTDDGTTQLEMIQLDSAPDVTYRLEWRHEYNASGDNLEVQLFSGNDITPINTVNSDLTSASPVAKVDFGVSGLDAFTTGDVLTSEHALDTEDWIGPAGAFDLAIDLVTGIESAASVPSISSVAPEEVEIDLVTEGIAGEASVSPVSPLFPEEVFIDLDTQGISSEASVTIPTEVHPTVSINLATEGIAGEASVSLIDPLTPGEAEVDLSGSSILSLEDVSDASLDPEEVFIDLDGQGIDDRAGVYVGIMDPLLPGTAEIDLAGEAIDSAASVSVVSFDAGSVEIDLSTQGIASEASVNPAGELIKDDQFLVQLGNIASEASVSLVSLSASVEVDLAGQAIDSAASVGTATLAASVDIDLTGEGISTAASVNSISSFSTTAEIDLDTAGITSEASVTPISGFTLEGGGINLAGQGIGSSASVNPELTVTPETIIDLDTHGIVSAASVSAVIFEIRDVEIDLAGQGIDSPPAPQISEPTVFRDLQIDLDTVGVTSSASVAPVTLEPGAGPLSVGWIGSEASVSPVTLEPQEVEIDLSTTGIASGASVTISPTVDTKSNLNVWSIDPPSPQVGEPTVEGKEAHINLAGQGLDDTPVPSAGRPISVNYADAVKTIPDVGGIDTGEIVNNIASLSIISNPKGVTAWGIGVVATPYATQVKDGVVVSGQNQILITDQDGNVIETTVY